MKSSKKTEFVKFLSKFTSTLNPIFWHKMPKNRQKSSLLTKVKSSQLGIKQLMSGGGVILIGTTLIPLLKNLF